MKKKKDLQRVLRNFKQKVVLMAFITFLVCVISSICILFFEKPYYKSSATLVLTGFSTNKTENGITNNDLTINSKLVDTYQEIIKSKKVLNQVIEKESFKTTPEKLAKKIKVSSVKKTEIISITVTDRNPQIATKIANDVASVFSKEVKKIYNIENVTILDSAEIPTSSANLSFLQQFLIAFIFGIIISIFFTFLVAYFDTTVKNIDQISDITGLQIVGKIPNYRGKKRGKNK